MKYVMNLVIITEFAPTQPSCNTSAQAAANCANMFASNNVQSSMGAIAGYVAALVAIYVVFRALGAVILAQKSKTVF